MATDTTMIFPIEQSRDVEAVKEVLSAPSVLTQMSDDFTRPVNEWGDLTRADIKVFLARDVRQPIGVWLFTPDNPICWKAHFAVLPVMYGDPVLNATLEVLATIWNNTRCLRIIAEIPEYNRLSLKFVQKVGFSIFGINSMSCMKHGVLWDQVMVGLSKPGATKWDS